MITHRASFLPNATSKTILYFFTSFLPPNHSIIHIPSSQVHHHRQINLDLNSIMPKAPTSPRQRTKPIAPYPASLQTLKTQTPKPKSTGKKAANIQTGQNQAAESQTAEEQIAAFLAAGSQTAEQQIPDFLAADSGILPKTKKRLLTTEEKNLNHVNSETNRRNKKSASAAIKSQHHSPVSNIEPAARPFCCKNSPELRPRNSSTEPGLSSKSNLGAA